METIKIIFILISCILSMIGVIMIYDARILTKKRFSFHDQNEGSKWMKICGFILTIVGLIAIFFIMK